MSGRASGGFSRAGTGRESGQALVELALVAPIMILILAGLVQFAVIFEQQIGVNNAIREAARRGATMATPDMAAATQNANWTLGELNAALAKIQGHDPARDRDLQVCFFTPSFLDPSGNHQVNVTVRAGYAHPLFMPLVSLILDRIDGLGDDALRSDSTVEFHVEQSGDIDIGSGHCSS